MLSGSNFNWRSLLFAPGNRADRLPKAFVAGADTVCIDLEDSVADADKEQARNNMVSVLPARLQPHLQAGVRINSADSKYYTDDVDALKELRKLKDSIFVMLPKARIDNIKDLQQRIENPLIALLEDANGIEEAYSIARQSRVFALMLGGADLVAKLGGQMLWDTLLYARSRLLMAASGSGCMAIDVPCLDFRQPEVVFAEVQKVKDLGYSCKAVIHPAQIPPVHRGFCPAPEEVARARAMIATFEDAGGSAVAYSGIMLDAPVIATARQIIERSVS